MPFPSWITLIWESCHFPTFLNIRYSSKRKLKNYKHSPTNKDNTNNSITPPQQQATIHQAKLYYDGLSISFLTILIKHNHNKPSKELENPIMISSTRISKNLCNYNCKTKMMRILFMPSNRKSLSSITFW